MRFRWAIPFLVAAAVAHADEPPSDGLVVTASESDGAAPADDLEPPPPPIFALTVGAFGLAPQAGAVLRVGRGPTARIDSGLMAWSPSATQISRGAFVDVGLRGHFDEGRRFFVEGLVGMARIEVDSPEASGQLFRPILGAGTGYGFPIAEAVKVELGVSALYLPFVPPASPAALPALVVAPRVVMVFDMNVR